MTVKFCSFIYQGEIVSKAVIKPILPKEPCVTED
jgi:hypothetical protein